MISRTVLLVGVSRTGGGLPPLQAVEQGLDDIQMWALAQGIPQAKIGRFSDASNGKVRIRELQDWIQHQNDDLQVPDQLIIYFSGHGFHGAAGEFWLLSDAPGNASEAVSLASTEALARNCSFNHVVLFSDACRVPSNNIQFGYITGSGLFPNMPPVGPSKPVDQFFASSLGQPALEVSDNGSVSSVYTAQLARSLSGLDVSLLEPEDKTRLTSVVVRAWPLKRFLPRAISQRLRALKINQGVIPDAIIASDPEMWLANFDGPFPTQPAPPSVLQADEKVGTSHAVGRVEDEDSSLRTRGISKNVSSDQTSFGPQVDDAPAPSPPSELFRMNLTLALSPLAHKGQQEVLDLQPFKEGSAPQSQRSTLSFQSNRQLFQTPQINWHFETECGFVITGGTVVVARSSPGVFVDQPSRTEVRISPRTMAPELALLQFAGGQGILLPAIPGQIGYVTTGSGGIVSFLDYEPSSQRPEWRLFENKSQSIRLLRTFLCATAAAGDLRLAVLSDAQLREVQQTMQYGEKEADLGLMVLLSYISYISRRIDLLNQLRSSALRQFNFLPMDMAILSQIGDPDFRFDSQPVLPPFPLLAQGWPLMDASNLQLPESLSGLRRHILPSAWTSVDAEGYRLIEGYLAEDRE